MRATYATYLEFRPAPALRDVHDVICRWLAGPAGAPADLRRTLRAPGRRTVPLVRSHHSLELDVIKMGEDLLWQSQWRRPSLDDPALDLICDIVLGLLGGEVSVGVTLGLQRTRGQLTPLRYDTQAPGVVCELVSRFPVCDDQLRLSARPRPLRAASTLAFCERVLFGWQRALPVLVLSCDRDGEPLADPRELARELCGLAHVYLADRGASRVMSERLGELSCWGGAARLYWPKMTRFDTGEQHPRFAPAQLQAWDTGFARILLRRIGAVAATTMSAPRAFAELRRRARRARLVSGDDIPAEWLAEMERVLAERDRLRAELGRARARVGQLEATLGEHDARLPRPLPATALANHG